jgi:hypothetical protein
MSVLAARVEARRGRRSSAARLRGYALAPFLFGAAAARAPAQDEVPSAPLPPVVYELDGPYDSALGSSTAALGDVDGDGAADFAVGAPGYTFEPFIYGYALLVSGATGEGLRVWYGPPEHRSFDGVLGALPDIDGDGVPEMALTYLDNVVDVVSPVTGDVLYTTVLGDTPRNSDAWDVVALGDVDGDGIGEFAASFPRAITGSPAYAQGRVAVFSGRDGSLLWERFGRWSDGELGRSIAAVADLSGDGAPDLLVAQPVLFRQQAELPPEESRLSALWLFDAASGEVLARFLAPSWMLGLGHSGIVVVGDSDGNGRDEVVVASHLAEHDGEERVGWIGCFELPDFTLRYGFFGESGRTEGRAADALGWTMSAVGDVDLDGVLDYVAGTYRAPSIAPYSYRRLYLRSGRDGSLIQIYDLYIDSHNVDFTVPSPLGDIDGDGIPEFLVAYDRSLEREDFGGHVKVLRYRPDRVPFRRGDPNQDGEISIADAIYIVQAVLEENDPLGCVAALDVNNTDRVTPCDAMEVVYYVFGVRPPEVEEPFRECAQYVRAGGPRVVGPREPLPCERHAGCP